MINMKPLEFLCRAAATPGSARGCGGAARRIGDVGVGLVVLGLTPQANAMTPASRAFGTDS